MYSILTAVARVWLSLCSRHSPFIYTRNRGLACDQSAATDKFTLCNQRDCIFLYFGVLVDIRIGFQFMLLGVGFLDEEYTHGSYYKQYAGKHDHVELMLTAK